MRLVIAMLVGSAADPDPATAMMSCACSHTPTAPIPRPAELRRLLLIDDSKRGAAVRACAGRGDPEHERACA